MQGPIVCAEKFAKKLLGETEIERVLRRLDRLTQEEGRMTMAQTLEIVYGLHREKLSAIISIIYQ